MNFKSIVILVAFLSLFGCCLSFKITAGFSKEALKSHNAYRKLHQVKPLKLEAKISKIAQQVAQNIANGSAGGLKHTNKTYMKKELGENLAMWSKAKTNSSEQAGKLCTDLWYNEVKLHDFKKDYQKKSGHFTQLVWKGSTHVGFGIALSKTSIVCVAMYHPAGNVLTKFKDNVLPTKKTPKKPKFF